MPIRCLGPNMNAHKKTVGDNILFFTGRATMSLAWRSIFCSPGKSTHAAAWQTTPSPSTKLYWILGEVAAQRYYTYDLFSFRELTTNIGITIENFKILKNWRGPMQVSNYSVQTALWVPLWRYVNHAYWQQPRLVTGGFHLSTTSKGF